MAVPTSEPVRVVGVDELFFSTTDRQGRIQEANSVFVDLSRYARSELLGAPHNIIRHPQMPAGAFAVMWDLLLAGRPMAAYVRNRAKDGATYWVFATITPLGDGFLSVRSAPCDTGLWSTVGELYTAVLEVEQQARRDGAGGVAAAEAGAQAISTALAGLGFATYGDFIRHALPTEVLARAARSGRVARPLAVTGRFGPVEDVRRRLDAELTDLLGRLEDFRALAGAVGAASGDALASILDLRTAGEAAAQASQVVADRAPVLRRAAEAVIDAGRRTGEVVGDLAQRLDAVQVWLMELRFRISLALLHSDMVGQFLIEVDDGERAVPGARRADADEGMAGVRLLCAALAEGIESATGYLHAVAQTLSEAARDVQAAELLLREFQHVLATWRLLVPRYQASREVEPYTGPVDALIVDGHERLAALRDLAQRCAREATPYDTAPLRAAVAQLTAAVAASAP